MADAAGATLAALRDEGAFAIRGAQRKPSGVTAVRCDQVSSCVQCQPARRCIGPSLQSPAAGLFREVNGLVQDRFVGSKWAHSPAAFGPKPSRDHASASSSDDRSRSSFAAGCVAACTALNFAIETLV